MRTPSSCRVDECKLLRGNNDDPANAGNSCFRRREELTSSDDLTFGELHQQMHVVQLSLELFSSTSKSVHMERKISSKRLRCLAVKAFSRPFVTNIE
jgi:hypothetical protein